MFDHDRDNCQEPHYYITNGELTQVQGVGDVSIQAVKVFQDPYQG